LNDRLHQSLAVITDDYEIILVEDCGGDDSWKKIKQFAEFDTSVIGI